jgi:hypothetical protein
MHAWSCNTADVFHKLQNVRGTSAPGSDTAQVTCRSSEAQFRAALSLALGSKSRDFHYKLYSELARQDKPTLRDIRSEFIEEWLREHDADLLHRHFVERKQVRFKFDHCFQ